MLMYFLLDDEARDSRPSTSEVPSRRSKVGSSQGIGIKSSTIHGSYTSLESIVNNVKEVRVGDLFPSKEELHMKMQLLSIGNHFQFKVKKSTKTLLVMSCIVEECKWCVRATKLKDCESFRIRKYSPDHTCSLDALHFDHRQASSKLIGHCIKSKFERTSQCYRPNNIIDDIKKQCGMTLGYNKAWRAREVALGLARGVAVHDIFYKCSKAYRVVEFNQIIAQIMGTDASVAQYLIEADPTKWARSHFDGRRYCIMTTNIAECLNGILKDARELPITKLVEHIRGLLQKWFLERREATVAKMSTLMTKWAEKKLRCRSNKSCCYRVHPINLYEHHVIDGYLNGFVNLIEKTCTCRKF
ncbi:hypothetical protein EZV62_027691 [Acer yangbiense]|uniref:Transposase MuDR plant domain-containing protein n=1 Tax=Acer yangbiense TaxID=1000413 RepID=A0A5C7GVA2_9ROSI|nr:hypothetical protein EZV62_027691 [Acer yangbiense]